MAEKKGDSKGQQNAKRAQEEQKKREDAQRVERLKIQIGKTWRFSNVPGQDAED